MPPRIAIDGVFFQIGNLGIARVWRSLLTEWVKSGFATHLLILDRQGTAPKISGIDYYPTPAYDFQNSAGECWKIQAICDRERVDLFMSTWYTTPISTPSLCLVHDLLQEVMELEFKTPFSQEKLYAIDYAVKYFAVSQHTAQDLRRFSPHIPSTAITVSLNGVAATFMPPPLAQIKSFRECYQILQPYFLLVGERYGYLSIGIQHNYKNAIHFFQAFVQLPNYNRFSIVCVGGQPELEPEIAMICEEYHLSVQLLSLDDRDLQSAYGGAIALVYPSLYEGFGLPVLEAISCGCPTITCANSAIPEVAGSAAIYISGKNISELVTALEKVQQPEIRSSLITAGLARAKHFSWTKMADTIARVLIDTHLDIQTGKLQPSTKLSWAQFRQAQSQHQQQFTTAQAQLITTQAQLASTQAQLATARAQISSMANTKFWQLRQRWFQLKKWLKLVDDSK
jgi:glycosyltransferase involved in cell wall biosynthesis